MMKKKRLCLTSWRLSFFDLSSARMFNSRSPFGGVINISLLFMSTLGTIASTNGTHTSGAKTRISNFGFPSPSDNLGDLLSLTCKRYPTPQQSSHFNEYPVNDIRE